MLKTSSPDGLHSDNSHMNLNMSRTFLPNVTQQRLDENDASMNLPKYVANEFESGENKENIRTPEVRLKQFEMIQVVVTPSILIILARAA